MTLTREIVKDLLAVYLAGDASADTRKAVEDWLAKDPDLAKQVAASRQSALPEVGLPEPSIEKRALLHTRRRLRLRGILLGVAIYVTTLPLTIVFNSQGFKGLLITDWLERVVVFALAAVLWVTYARVARGLRV